MFNTPFSNINTSPLVCVDNILSLSYLMDNLPSPLFCNEFDNLDFVVSNQDLSTIQGGLMANHNNNLITSFLTDDSSIVEVDNKVDSNKGDESTKKRKKRSSNKDRHSKIRTAHGLRDRRMRLSLQVARPFFQLQDVLGFDKASRTVEWLLIQSSKAIDELFRSSHGSPSGVANYAFSSTSDECEVQSMVVEESKEVMKSSSSVRKDEPRKKRKKTITKEERKKARDWARKRTSEKLQRRVEDGAEDINCLTKWVPLSSSSYLQSYEVCQAVPSYTISTLPKMVGGPQ